MVQMLWLNRFLVASFVIFCGFSAKAKVKDFPSCVETDYKLFKASALSEGERSPYGNWYFDPLTSNWSLDGSPFEYIGVQTKTEYDEIDMRVRIFEQTKDGSVKVFDKSEKLSNPDLKMYRVSNNFLRGTNYTSNFPRPAHLYVTIKVNGDNKCLHKITISETEDWL